MRLAGDLSGPAALLVPVWLVAQMGKASSGILFWIAVLIVVVLAAGILWVFLRKRVFESQHVADGSGLMDQLRDARDRGLISPEEYEASRDALLGRRPKAHRVVRGEIFEDGTIRARPGLTSPARHCPTPRPAPVRREEAPRGRRSSRAPSEAQCEFACAFSALDR